MVFFENSVFFGVLLSLLTYGIGSLMKAKLKLPIFNPLLISILLSVLILVVFRIDYSTYYEGAKYLSYLLTPATICLAVPLYEQMELLKKNWKAIFGGIFAGVLTSLGIILIMAFLHVTKYLISPSKPLMLIVISNKQAVRVVQCVTP